MKNSQHLISLLGITAFLLLPSVSALGQSYLPERHWDKLTYQISVMDADSVWHEGIFVFADTAGLVMLDGQNAWWGVDSINILYLSPSQIQLVKTERGLSKFDPLWIAPATIGLLTVLVALNTDETLKSKAGLASLLGLGLGLPLVAIIVIVNNEHTFYFKPFAVAGQRYGTELLVGKLGKANLIQSRDVLTRVDLGNASAGTIEEAYNLYQDKITVLHDIYEAKQWHFEGYIARRYGPGYQNIYRRWFTQPDPPNRWQLHGLKLNYALNDHLSVGLLKERGGMRDHGKQDVNVDSVTRQVTRWKHRSVISSTYGCLEFKHNLLPNRFANLYISGGINLGVERFTTRTRIKEEVSDPYYLDQTVRNENIEEFQRRFFGIRPTAQVQFEAIHWIFTLGATATKLPDITYQAITLDLPEGDLNYPQQTFSLDYWQMHFGVGYRF